MNKPLSLFKVLGSITIRDAIRKMDDGGLGFICVVDVQDRIVGVVSNGDFRRSVLKEVGLNRPISAIMNTQYRFLKVGFTQTEALDIVSNTEAQHIPVLDNKKLIGLVNVEDFLPKGRKRYCKEDCIVPLVVMAGGQGTRLAPFTHILPKPLMPLGDKPVIEHILSEFSSFGIRDVIISVNHKARIIKAYFEEAIEPYTVRFITEQESLGTAGALRLMKEHIQIPFFMTNCDILVKENYWEIYDFHQRERCDVTMVVAQKRYAVPYGVCHIHNDGNLDKIDEKPELNLLINTGLYVISPLVLDFIPEGQIFNMDDLIGVLQRNGKKVGVFPVDEKAFVDIGQLDEYKAAFQKMGSAFNVDFGQGAS